MYAIAEYRWPRGQREDYADVLVSKTCPECGDDMVYRPWAEPHHNPASFMPDRTAHGAVIFGQWRCRAYGQCELAGG